MTTENFSKNRLDLIRQHRVMFKSGVNEAVAAGEGR